MNNLSGIVRSFCLALLLTVASWNVNATVTTLFEKTETFAGSGFQYTFWPSFSISTPGLVTATLTDTQVLSPFVSLGMAVFRTGGAAVAPALTAPGSFTFDPSVTGFGNYTVLVFGERGSPLSVYGATLTQVAPIPEPEIWALMLVGTGLVGFQLRRKRKAAEASRVA